METLITPSVEKVPTGAIVIISGEYLPVDSTDHPTQVEPTFFGFGETTPGTEDDEVTWKLLEAYDFIS